MKSVLRSLPIRPIRPLLSCGYIGNFGATTTTTSRARPRATGPGPPARGMAVAATTAGPRRGQHAQERAHAASLRDPEAFWTRQAARLEWHREPERALARSTRRVALSKKEDEEASTVEHAAWTWFPGGELSTCHNCVDRHVAAGRGDAAAIVWDSPVTGKSETYTYAQLLKEVETLAGGLRQEGVRRGDTVLVYMPMVPAALIALLAIGRLGAVHAVVFGGFSAPALAQRIDGCTPKAIMTCSCGVEGAKGAIAYRPLIEGAIARAAHKPALVFVWQRDELRWDGLDRAAGYRNWNTLVRSCRARNITAAAVPVKSEDPSYIIYTSGTTGAPKGVQRDTAGHAVGLALSARHCFGVRGPGDVLFTASDIGWVVGHSYILYAPLLAGGTTVLFEGKPVGTPDAGTFWRVVRRHRVNVMFTAPTALRAIRREDPDNKYFEEAAADGGLRHVRALFLAGERSEPAIVLAYRDLLRRHGAPGAQVVDNWWSSESGSPITALAQIPDAGEDGGTTSTREIDLSQVLAARPGAAGKPMPGFDVRIVDDDGRPVKDGDMGNIVLGLPLAPTGLTTLWKDEARFYRGYLQRFGGRYMDTGDAGMIDDEGYVHIMSRSDDIINVAAHRLSTGAIEQAITSHPAVAEACVVAIPDSLKGHLPFAFATLSTAEHPASAVPARALLGEVQALVREQIGGIAALGGLIQGKGMIPKTRSGKTLRRVLRQLVEQAARGRYDDEVQVPATVEDAGVVDVARQKVREYFENLPDAHKELVAKARL